MSIDRSYLQRFDVIESQTIKCYKEVGWDCLVIWDKELKMDVHAVEGKLRAFVGRCDE
jgi:G:T-mismatch repair DNA endonuclease (very short patch repair protein)